MVVPAVRKSNGFNWIAVIGTVMSGLIAGSVGGIIGIQLGVARLEIRVAALEVNDTTLHKEVTELDQRGSRTLPVIDARLTALEAKIAANMPALDRMMVQGSAFEQRIKLLEDTVNTRTKTIEELIAQSRTLTPLQQSIADNIRGDIRRLDDRQDRLTAALDSTYNLLNEHLRTIHGKK